MAFLATIFTWSITAAGAALVFVFKRPEKNIMDAMLGFAGGVMIAASFWSLLSPSIAMSEELNLNPVLMAAGGFISGGLFLFAGDRYFDRILISKTKNNTFEKSKIKRCLMLLYSILLYPSSRYRTFPLFPDNS